jgi:hypothetical protein
MADENSMLPLSVEATEQSPYHSLPDHVIKYDPPKQTSSFPCKESDNVIASSHLMHHLGSQLLFLRS